MSFNAMSTEQPDGTVGNDGWFPSLSVRLFLTLYRLPGEYAADLVSDHLRLGMVCPPCGPASCSTANG